MAHFNATMLKIPDLNESMAMFAMNKGFQSSKLTFFLDKKLSRSYSELLAHAQKYALAEKQAISQFQAEGN